MALYCNTCSMEVLLYWVQTFSIHRYSAPFNTPIHYRHLVPGALCLVPCAVGGKPKRGRPGWRKPGNILCTYSIIALHAIYKSRIRRYSTFPRSTLLLFYGISICTILPSISNLPVHMASPTKTPMFQNSIPHVCGAPPGLRRESINSFIFCLTRPLVCVFWNSLEFSSL